MSLGHNKFQPPTFPEIRLRVYRSWNCSSWYGNESPSLPWMKRTKSGWHVRSCSWNFLSNTCLWKIQGLTVLDSQRYLACSPNITYFCTYQIDIWQTIKAPIILDQAYVNIHLHYRIYWFQLSGHYYETLLSTILIHTWKVRTWHWVIIQSI